MVRILFAPTTAVDEIPTVPVRQDAGVIVGDVVDLPISLLAAQACLSALTITAAQEIQGVPVADNTIPTM